MVSSQLTQDAFIIEFDGPAEKSKSPQQGGIVLSMEVLKTPVECCGRTSSSEAKPMEQHAKTESSKDAEEPVTFILLLWMEVFKD